MQVNVLEVNKWEYTMKRCRIAVGLFSNNTYQNYDFCEYVTFEGIYTYCQ